MPIRTALAIAAVGLLVLVATIQLSHCRTERMTAERDKAVVQAQISEIHLSAKSAEVVNMKAQQAREDDVHTADSDKLRNRLDDMFVKRVQ